MLRPGGRIVLTMIPPTISQLGTSSAARGTPTSARHEGRRGLGRPKAVRRLRNAGFVVAAESRFMLGVNRLTIALKPAAVPATVTRSHNCSGRLFRSNAKTPRVKDGIKRILRT